MYKINREQLLKELEYITPGLSSKEIVEQSNCFIFKNGNVTTYNDDIACSLKTCLKIEGAIQATTLMSLLQKLPDEEIEVEVTKKELLIEGKNRKAGVVMEKDVSSLIDKIGKPKQWNKLSVDFPEAVKTVQDCVSNDETQFNMTCVHLHPNWIESCDNYQACRYNIKTKVNESILIRKESLKHIIFLNMTEFGETKSWIHFKNSIGLILSCRRYVEKYPDVSKVLNVKGNKMSLPKGLKNAAERASIFSAEDIGDNYISIKLDNDKLGIEGRGVLGWFNEKKKIKYKGQPLSFTVSPSLLIKLIQRYNECEITENRLKITGDKFEYITCLGKEKGK